MSQDIKPIMIKKFNNQLPLLLKNRGTIKKDVLQFRGNVKVVKFIPFQQDVLYEGKSGDFLPGDLREITILNRLYKANNSCRTIAKCKSQSGDIFEKTSDEITKLIGQNNYDNLFASLCSVINQELRIRGIFSLLTVPKSNNTASCQTDISKSPSVIDIQCQTTDSYITTYKKLKMRRRAKRSQLTPYVIREVPETKEPKRVLIEPSNFMKMISSEKNVIEEGSQKEESILPDLGPFLDEDSNNSVGRFSSLSIRTTSDIILNPWGILDNVDKVMRKTPELLHNDTEYKLHNLDTPNYNSDSKLEPLSKILCNMPAEQKIKMLLLQGLNDWNSCLQRDESDHLPIHVAVLNNDLDLLKRQCLVLKNRGISVDIPADNLTPLKMSLYKDNVQLTNLLLEYNADALASDTYDRNCFHIASEMSTEHLETLVNYYKRNARRILEVEELWKPDYANKTDSELVKILFVHINELSDSQGYTPLMLASKLGRYENVRLLLENSPETVNTQMLSSGNTALYLAVGAACMDAVERGNRSKIVDHFKQTIEILVENGAEPNLTNFAGASVNDLLTEYNIGDISMLIANKLTRRNFSDGKLPSNTNKFEAFMLVRDQKGNLMKLEDAEKSPKPTSGKSKVGIKVNNKKTVNTPKRTSSKKVTIVKSEILTEDKMKPSVAEDKSSNKSRKIDAKVQNFQLNKPVILKTILSKMNKRKLEIVVDPNSKKSKTND